MPLLAFHFADDLPTFSLSVINELPSQIDHKDLDTLYALEIPTIPPFRESRANSASLARLNALGMDAYNLAESIDVDTGKLSSLQRGYTGLLYLDDEKKLIRRMNLYRYDQETLRRE
jgi:outer membrane PBP1 activator LpoA protein